MVNKIIKFKVDLGVELSGSCCLVPDELIYPLDSRILFAPLNEEVYKCWLLFKHNFGWQRDHDLSYAKRKMFDILKGDSLQLNHPVVRVVSNFAVAAFNKLYAMYVKKGEEEYIYEADVTKVRFLPNDYGFSFFITLEALEENIAGVYEATESPSANLKIVKK